MLSVSASEFVQNFGLYREEVQRAPIAVTSYGRVSGYFVSATDYERMRATARNVYGIEDMPEELFEAICGSRMDSRHDGLNALLEQGK